MKKMTNDQGSSMRIDNCTRALGQVNYTRASNAVQRALKLSEEREVWLETQRRRSQGSLQ